MVAALLLATATLDAQDAIRQRAAVVQALDYLRKNEAAHIEKQIQLSQIPSPTFQEAKRGVQLAAEFRRVGLTDIETDARGNVLGWRKGESERALVIAAHLDTVFPIETDVTVKREPGRLTGPGIGDDARGLAALLGVAEALRDADIRTKKSLLFVADCCEEGLGDLLGIKYLLQQGKYKDQIDAFLSIDGIVPARIVNGALASKRYRITISGPGGHSWENFGRPNPAHALGRVIARFAGIKVPAEPKTTYNVGTIGGGTSINSVPFYNWMEVDMRSESDVELERLEQQLLEAVRLGVDEENRFRAESGVKLTAESKLLTVRYGGKTPPDASLVQAAMWANRSLGFTPVLGTASTDSNVPINMGIPA
ncbi:MAG: M20/M25/M40 family metallo-hydrolase, partial [Bryobacteraceae bacterium]